METVNRKQKILLVTNNYRPYSGGVVSAIQLLADQLIKQGHTILLVTFDFGTKEIDPEYVIRISSFITFSYKKNRMALARFPKKKLRHIINQFKPDIIHVHHPFLLGLWATHIARKYTIPVIFHYHTRYQDYSHYAPLVPQNIMRWIIKKYVKRFCTLVDKIIVPTQSLKQELCVSGIQTSIEVIPTALPENCFAEFFPKYISAQEPIKLLTVSRFAPEKNLYFLLDLLGLLDQEKYQFTLVGYGALEESLRNYAYQKHHFSDHYMRFIIRPAKNELQHIYQSSNIFLFSSKTETQGLVLAEALAAGVPLIALKAPGANEAIDNGSNGYLVEDIQEMRDAIQLVTKDRQTYNQFRAKAFESARAYAPDQWIQKIIKVYETFIK